MSNYFSTKKLVMGEAAAKGSPLCMKRNGKFVGNSNSSLTEDGSLSVNNLNIQGKLYGGIVVPEFSDLATAQSSISVGDIYYITGNETLKILREPSFYVVTFSQAILVDSPLVYYDMSDALGSAIMADQSGNGRNGSYRANTLAKDYDSGYEVGKGWYHELSGHVGNDITAANYGLTVSNDASLEVAFPCTLEVWFSAVGRNHNGNRILLGWTTANRPRMHILGGTPFGFEYLFISNDINGTTINTSAVVTFNQSMHQLVLVFKTQTTMDVYLNGIKTNTDMDTTSMALGASGVNFKAMGIGNNAPASAIQRAFYNGSVNEFAIFPSALSDARILAHWNIGSAIP